ncbi:MAG: endonuclease III [Sedimentisphaerales bacterium]|nr:endonuclease III [Sedimentisphaerales bacterium]
MAKKKATPRKPTRKKTTKSQTSGFDKATAAQRIKKIWPLLRKTYPDAKIALNFSNPVELLVATILSAQCTDVRVNIVTKDLFQKYRCAADWAQADQKQLEEDIKSTGFFRNKAQSIKGACTKIVAEHKGQVPQTMEELTTLPGVGRKTANVLLGNAFDIPGIVCDTHVIRLARRLGLSDNTDPVKLEFDLADIVPRKQWTLFSHLLIFHGRSICKARKPDCPHCPIAKHCPAANRPDKW